MKLWLIETTIDQMAMHAIVRSPTEAYAIELAARGRKKIDRSSWLRARATEIELDGKYEVIADGTNEGMDGTCDSCKRTWREIEELEDAADELREKAARMRREMERPGA